MHSALALRNAQIYEEQRLMARRQAALYGVMRSVGEQLNPQDVATAAVSAIVRLVDGDARWPGVGIALPDPDGYTWVQRNAMPVWRGQGNFLDLLKADKDVSSKLSAKELESLFDLGYHTRHVDTIFKRVFG